MSTSMLKDVSGEKNPRWKGGPLSKVCAICGVGYSVKRVNAASQYCSLQCVGVSQRGKTKLNPKRVLKDCECCGSTYEVPASHASRYHCCSRACSFERRSVLQRGELNANWTGGLSRQPYPWNFRDISRVIIARDGHQCKNPDCDGRDQRMTAHHINYDKQDCRPGNLITLCSACNSKANFGRPGWQQFYSNLMTVGGV